MHYIMRYIKRPDGRNATLSAECDGENFENIPLENVVELMSIGFTGDSCVLSPKWSNIPGEIVERRNSNTK